MRVIEYSGTSPTEWGRQHGEAFRDDIRSLAAIRIHLCRDVGGFASDEAVLEVARSHIDVLRSYDEALFAEMNGIAEGAGVSLDELIVLNHYTDLRDLGPNFRQGHDEDGGCSVLWSRAGSILAQTWDMHISAMPFVMMIKVPALDERPAMWLLSLTGCLGMAGMNEWGMGVVINNLRSKDATVGVVWSALVRRALAEKTALSAIERLEDSPIGSGHHYGAGDENGYYAIETSGTRKIRVFDNDGDVFAHTNHCVNQEIGAVTDVPATSTTYLRFNQLQEKLTAAPIITLQDSWDVLGTREGFPGSICTNVSTVTKPHGSATCGALAMNLSTRQLWATAGFVSQSRPTEFHL